MESKNSTANNSANQFIMIKYNAKLKNEPNEVRSEHSAEIPSPYCEKIVNQLDF
jgi:hypothetical protein